MNIFLFKLKQTNLHVIVFNNLMPPFYYFPEPEVRDMSLKPKNASNQVHHSVSTISFIVCIFSMLLSIVCV